VFSWDGLRRISGCFYGWFTYIAIITIRKMASFARDAADLYTILISELANVRMERKKLRVDDVRHLVTILL